MSGQGQNIFLEGRDEVRTRWDKTKLWLANHQDAIAVVGVGTFVVVGATLLVRAEIKATARALEAQHAMVDLLNGWAEDQRQAGAPLYPVA